MNTLTKHTIHFRLRTESPNEKARRQGYNSVLLSGKILIPNSQRAKKMGTSSLGYKQGHTADLTDLPRYRPILQF